MASRTFGLSCPDLLYTILEKEALARKISKQALIRHILYESYLFSREYEIDYLEDEQPKNLSNDDEINREINRAIQELVTRLSELQQR